MSRKKKNSSNFLVQGSILAVAGIIVRVIGLVYRVPLQNILGPTGAGLYTSAFNVYTILLLLSSYSLPLAVSKMVSARVSMGEYRNTRRVLYGALILALVVGIVIAIICFFGAGFFARVLLKEENAIIAIRALTPCVFIMTFLGVFRGFFQGLGSMVPTALSQIVEQIFNAVFSLVGAFLLAKAGAAISKDMQAAYGAAGGTIGTTVGALSALIVLVFLFMAYQRNFNKLIKRDEHRKLESYENIAKMIFRISLPVILSTTVYNISTLVDQSIYGYSVSGSYMATWGIYSGIYLMLINVPIAMANALASSAIPTLTMAVTNRDRSALISETSLTIRFTMIIAIPASVGLMVLAHPIVNMLFSEGTELGGSLLFCGAAAVAFFSLSTVMNGILQGINHMTTPVRNACLALILHIAILVLGLYAFHMDIFAVVFSNMMFGLTMCILNGRCIADFLQYDQEIYRTFVLPTVAAIVMGVVCYAFYSLFRLITASNLFSTLVAIIVAIVVYGVLLLLLHCVDEVELYKFPMGGRLVGLAKSMRLL